MNQNIKYLIEDKNNDIDFLFLIRVILKRIKLFSILFVLFLTLFFTYVFILKKEEYISKFPISINSIASQFVINDLKNASCFTNNELQKNINYSAEELKQLNYIQLSNIDKNSTNIVTATITINTKTQTQVKLIVDKLINWTLSNPNIKRQIKFKKSSLNSLINKTDEQLIEIKKLKKKYLNSESITETKLSFLEEFQILELKHSLMQELEELNNITFFTSQIYTPLNATNTSKTLPVFFSILASLILSVLITLISNIKKNN